MKAVMMLLAGLSLLLVGCATNDFPIATTQSVGDRIKPLEDRLARLEAAAAADKTRLDQLIGRVNEQGTQLTQTTGTANRALEAGNAAGQKADQGMAKANEVDGRVTRSLSNRYKRGAVQEFSVAFESGKSVLSDEAQLTLQRVVKLLADNPTYTADLMGYTDDVGDARFNVNLSWRREEAIRRLLVERGGDLNRIFFIGLGEEVATGKDAPGRTRDRRGTIRVYRPED